MTDVYNSTVVLADLMRRLVELGCVTFAHDRDLGWTINIEGALTVTRQEATVLLEASRQ